MSPGHATRPASAAPTCTYTAAHALPGGTLPGGSRSWPVTAGSLDEETPAVAGNSVSWRIVAVCAYRPVTPTCGIQAPDSRPMARIGARGDTLVDTPAGAAHQIRAAPAQPSASVAWAVQGSNLRPWD